jgi:predicted transcriptional regulator
MQIARNVLTPEALAMLQTIASSGSFAAAARALGMVPSALTYRVRQLEDALDVLLFDRSSRRALPTVAGHELLREGERLDFAPLLEMSAGLQALAHKTPCHAEAVKAFSEKRKPDFSKF